MNMKEAFLKAKNELENLNEGLGIHDIRLEEAEKLTTKWKIVVSYLVPNKNKPQTLGNLISSVNLPYERIYKEILIEDTGNIKVKIFNHER